MRAREGQEAARQKERRDAAARVYGRLRLEAEAAQRAKVGAVGVCLEEGARAQSADGLAQQADTSSPPIASLTTLFCQHSSQPQNG